MANSEIEIETEIQRSSPASTIVSSSASTSASSSSADPMVYDVFLNHRGPDTKKTFAGHLYRRLISHGFRAFLDEKELEGGFDFPSQIIGAIRSASVHVAIFSPRYTESPWCLNELLLMRETQKPIIPVFYKVKPTDLRYGQVLRGLEEKTTADPQTGTTRPRYDRATIQNWRNVLSSVAEISGFDLGAFNGDEIHMLDKVVECVLKRVKITPLHVAKYATGLAEKVKDFEATVLKQHQQGGKVQVLGIVGLGGMGKTTLALELFNRKSSNYNKSYFLADVRENARSSSLHSLQSKVMKGLTQMDMNIDNIHQGTGMLEQHLQACHVLLILDDIDDEKQLDAFLPLKDVLRSDSLILITSRDRDVLRKSGVEEFSIYKLAGLPTKHSRELFCSYAFCQAYPPRGFEDLVNNFIKTCQGLPLSLKVFGALLSGKNGKSFWEDTLFQVQQQVPGDIQKRLRISYDALHEREQQIFLDIACFFIGEKRDMTVGIWDEPQWKGSLGFQNLESKCLVEVDGDNNIHMHDHLRDMGRDIARSELPSRLWHLNDLQQLSSGVTEVRSISMFLNEDNDTESVWDLAWVWDMVRGWCCNWGSDSGADLDLDWGLDFDDYTSPRRQRNTDLFGNSVLKLHNKYYRFRGIGVMKLQLLETQGHLLERILRRVHSPNLIWLSWSDCPYSYLPSWIPMHNLRVLQVEGAVFKTLWQGRSQAPFQLRVLEISGNLLKISKSIGQLKHLEQIFFGRVSFQKLPEEFCNLTLLKVLMVKQCRKLNALPDSFGNLTNLQHMELSKCYSLRSLPESFGNLLNLQHMELSKCFRLRSLPESFGNLLNLQHMELSSCFKLRSLPESFGNLPNLRHMELSSCLCLRSLPESFGNLRNLQQMVLSWCESLEFLPESLGNLLNLQVMKLSGCESLEFLPESFGNLLNLQLMKLYGCGSLQSLPQSLCHLQNLQHMDLSHCGSLQSLPKCLGHLPNLQELIC